MSPTDDNRIGIIYCRVSSKDQVDGTSLESQERHCREWAERHHVHVAGVYVDRGESAKTIDRTEFLKAIAFCSHRKNRVTDFIVYKIDRFARSQDDHVSVRATLRRHGVELRSATEPISDTPVGRAMEGMISVFAEFDNNVRRERCVGGMLERLRQGVWVWQAPLGYRRLERGGNLVPDPEFAPYIRLAFSTYADGAHTYEALAQYLAERGMRTPKGKKPSPQLVFKILTNRLYCGTIEAWGARHQGAFEPLVGQELFDRCQPGWKRSRSTAGPRVRSRYNPAFPLRGVICSECGGRLTGSFSRSARGRLYPYYHHQRQGCRLDRSVPKAVFEQAFIEYLQQIRLDERFEKLFVNALRQRWKHRTASREAEQLRRAREIDSLSQERQQIFELHRSGRYTDEEFREQKTLVDARLIELRGLQTATPTDDFSPHETLQDILRLAREPATTWARLTEEPRRRFQILVFNNRGIHFDGTGFWNSELSNIYRLNQAFTGGDSTCVDLRGEIWNQIVEDLRAWADFAGSLSQGDARESQLRLAA
jgi:DNA invertase Pin-like site-specific DNA recombinase